MQNDIALFVGDKACPVKDDAIVAAHEIHEHDRHLLAFCTMRDHVATKLDLALVVGRRVDRNNDVGSHPYDLVRRIAVVEPFLPKSLVVPEIFANNYAELDAVDLEYPARIIRLEIAWVVEYIVFRQKRLVGITYKLAVMDHRGTIK